MGIDGFVLDFYIRNEKDIRRDKMYLPFVSHDQDNADRSRQFPKDLGVWKHGPVTPVQDLNSESINDPFFIQR